MIKYLKGIKPLVVWFLKYMTIGNAVVLVIHLLSVASDKYFDPVVYLYMSIAMFLVFLYSLVFVKITE